MYLNNLSSWTGHEFSESYSSWVLIPVNLKQSHLKCVNINDFSRHYKHFFFHVDFLHSLPNKVGEFASLGRFGARLSRLPGSSMMHLWEMGMSLLSLLQEILHKLIFCEAPWWQHFDELRDSSFQLNLSWAPSTNLRVCKWELRVEAPVLAGSPIMFHPRVICRRVQTTEPIILCDNAICHGWTI